MIQRIRDWFLILLVIFISLVLIFIIWGGILAYESNPVASVIFSGLFGILLLLLIYWLIRKFLTIREQIWISRINKLLTSEIDLHLKHALEIMDTTANWYNNEEEANRELVTSLKSMGIYATYQHKLGNGRTVDAKVGNILIEGKLSPDTAEVDRLIGQLSDYTQYGNQVNVVIYGQLDDAASTRIKSEIIARYPNKVFLTYLNNPQRHRSLSS